MLPKFLSWLIICKFWLNHHHVLGLARHAKYALVWLNSIFLMFQSFIPFPTAMTGEYATNPLAVSMFGVVMAFNALLFIALHAYILRNLIKPELADLQDPQIIRKSFVGGFFLLDRRWRRLVQRARRVLSLSAYPAIFCRASYKTRRRATQRRKERAASSAPLRLEDLAQRAQDQAHGEHNVGVSQASPLDTPGRAERTAKLGR